MSLPNGHSINTAPLDEHEDSEPLIENDAVPPQCCSARLNLAFLMFFGFSVVYGLRVNLSVAMVAMVNNTDPKPAKNSSVIYACPLPESENSSDSFQQPEGIPQYPWDSETQGWLLGAFFFGYLCTQIPGGYLSGHYGGKIFLGLGVLGTAVLTLLTPLAANMGSYWLFSLRALEGFGEGVTFPAMMAMWARWAPPLERSRLMTLSGSGANFGAFLALPLTGYICETLGWPAVFYLCGGAGCLWAVFWFIFVSDDPRTHHRISKEERDYIINSIGSQGKGHGWSVPVLSMLMSVPLWAIIVTQICANWSYYTLLTSLPTYMNSIMHFDLKSNGFLSALPYLGAWLLSMLSGVVADSLIERKVFSITVVRKLFTLAGLLPAAAFLVAVGYAGCSHILTVTFLTLSTTIGGTTASGVYINQIDIAPRYAGFLLGITNTFGTIPGVLAPIATGYFTKDHTLAGWRMVFWVAAGINVGGALFYTLFGSGKIQPWADMEDERAETEKDRSRSIST
ncbi:sialin isoform X1 [Cottoperca gobio]|uniref:Sialin n=1 Tax=Cottoperca gobio TaxID=56716 RepID=A0A6J2QLP8_COTGO|nr:sialin isoform X1 [Cottoperca gobio]XP_029299314.1 sialin isoform X1 [Cottoperca gobio]XP_029299315.1 sialin isoform X1 [Cottoperca gobio]XP_029299316.1 sialin isoform X1 [Cottoperca gobio]XP_029299317.1 sialin isoform X1 [Cottoperca gobio]XP_029299318.1 sialin isoform X1 [Cottoperca gobio]